MKYLASGKLGDLIHSLIVCKFNYELNGNKATIYITDKYEKFEYGLEFTYRDLYPILLKQQYVESFEIHTNQPYDINLSEFRYSPLLYKKNWLEIYSNLFLGGVNISQEYKWIDLEKDNSLSNTLLINRSLKPLDDRSKEVYISTIDQFDSVYFLCFNEKQYDNFPLKDRVHILKVDTLYDFFVKINSCCFFLGNQSGPFAIASSLNVPRAVELLNTPDKFHYIDDWKYYKYFSYWESF